MSMAQAHRAADDEPRLVPVRRSSGKTPPQSPLSANATYPANLSRADHASVSGGQVPPTVPETRPAAVAPAPPMQRDGPEAVAADRDDTVATTGPVSPKTSSGVASPGTRSVNEKAQAFADAHRERVSSEAAAYLEAETRKLEARAQGLQAKAEKQRLHEEAKALEKKKKEELRADQLVAEAQIEADKIVAKANEKAVMIKARANEEAERAIADAKTRAERSGMEFTEDKKREIAELSDKVETMKVAGELPPETHRGIVQKVKDKVSGRHH